MTTIELNSNQVAYVHSDPKLGGLEDEQPADDEVRQVLASIENHVRSKFSAGFTKIEPLSYRTQVVAGKNYYIKVSPHFTFPYAIRTLMSALLFHSFLFIFDTNYRIPIVVFKFT